MPVVDDLGGAQIVLGLVVSRGGPRHDFFGLLVCLVSGVFSFLSDFLRLIRPSTRQIGEVAHLVGLVLRVLPLALGGPLLSEVGGILREFRALLGFTRGILSLVGPKPGLRRSPPQLVGAFLRLQDHAHPVRVGCLGAPCCWPRQILLLRALAGQRIRRD